MKFLDYTLLNNTLGSLLFVLSIILIVSLCRRWLSRYIASLLFIPIQQKWKSVSKNHFIGLIIKPLGWFITVLIAIIAIGNLNFPKEWLFTIYGDSFDSILLTISRCIIIITFIWVLQGFINFVALVLEANALATKDKRDDQLIVFFRDFVKAIIYIIGILFVLKIGFKVDIGALLTGLSIIGAALALAAKESIENLIASFIIFFDKPFYTGDTVKVNNLTGTIGKIEHIGLRSTRIRTTDQTLVTVPNKQMVDSVVDNWSMRTSRRSEIKIEFDNANNTALIEHFIAETKTYLQKKNPTINKFTVFLTDFSKSSTTVTIEYFTIPFSMDEFLTLKQEVNIYLKQAIETKEIKMATAGNDINIYNSDSGNGSSNISSQII